MLPSPIFIGTALFVLGACIGSFLNVVIWRSAYLGQPVTFAGKTAGLSMSWPPSHCPNCHTAIPWYLNIPVLAWLWLRGRCATCRQKIPVRYPLVELATGLSFAGLYLAYFHSGWGQPLGLGGTKFPHIIAAVFSVGAGHQHFHGIFDGGITLALDLILVAVLFAASGIDADWYEIPTALTHLLLAAGLLASLFGLQPGLPAVNPAGIAGRMAIGGTAGLLVSLGLLWSGVLPRSFSQVVRASSDTGTTEGDAPGPGRTIAPMPGPKQTWPSMVAALLILLMVAAAWLWASGTSAALIMLIAAMLLFLLGILPRSNEAADETQQVLEESAAPSARREILKELLFLVPPAALAAVAAFIPFSLPHAAWLQRALGVLLGMLLGGALIWLTRILGTLAFNKVAMGLGDVHLMAAIGAVVGTRLVLPIFFIAPVLGLLWAIVLKFMGKPNVLPYGPWLSMAAILALLIGWPIEHWYLLKIFAASAAPVVVPMHWPGTP
ncbi:MAG: A24 family peptidase [Phycisphaerae bacterium]|nr:A24 family peptidase [Phycisphaerae bacterium]